MSGKPAVEVDLFGEAALPEVATSERQREQSRLRQTRWRRRHAFAAPLYDEGEWTPLPGTRTSEGQ